MPLARVRLIVVCALLAACAGSDAVDPSRVPRSITVTPDAPVLTSLGIATRLTAEVRNASGGAVANQVVTWSRRGSGATQVSDSGVVTAIADGVDTIVATSGALTGRAVVTVQQTAVTLSLVSSSTTLSVLGASLGFTASALDANGRLVPTEPVVWSSSDASVLPVNPTGTTSATATAARPGTADVIASVGTLTARRTISVSLTSPVGGPQLGATVPCVGGFAGPFPCSGVDLLAFLPVSGLGGGPGIDLNDLWGWTDPDTNKEYVIAMRRDGAAFVDVSNATNPVYLGYLPITPGASPNIWHDVKVYADHAFIVADAAGPHGMQVFDLRRLRAHAGVPRTFTADFTYRLVNSAHNIAINEASGHAYIVGASGGGTTCSGGLHMVDIRTPAAPAFAGCFADSLTGRAATGYTHDVQCVLYTGPDVAYRGREICLGSNETHLSIADVTNKQAPVAIARASYPQVAYTHQGWLTEDQRFFLVNDEVDEINFGLTGTRTLIWDVQELQDPILVGQFYGPNPASDHNHYIRGTRMYASTYQFGLRIVDVTNPAQPTAFGFFDTAPNLLNVAGFGGSWSNYPYFRSGIVVMTSRTEGFFVLRVP